MREYTAKQIKELKANPYTLKVTKNKLYFTIQFYNQIQYPFLQFLSVPRKIK